MTSLIECVNVCRAEKKSVIACIRECIHGGDKPSPPPSLFSIVYKATGCKNIHIPDKHLYLPTNFDMKRWLSIDKTDKKEYRPEIWDCDDSARTVWNNIRNIALNEGKNIAFALIWTTSHALNLYVNNELKVVYIEPQTDLETTIHSKPRFVIF